MRSTHDHEDRSGIGWPMPKDLVRYWLTDAKNARQVLVDEGGGQSIPDKVFMVMSRQKSKVYYWFLKLAGISFIKIDTFIILRIS